MIWKIVCHLHWLITFNKFINGLFSMPALRAFVKSFVLIRLTSTCYITFQEINKSFVIIQNERNLKFLQNSIIKRYKSKTLPHFHFNENIISFQGGISKVYIRHFAWANGRVAVAGVQGGRRVERCHPASTPAPSRDRYVIWAGRHGDRELSGAAPRLRDGGCTGLRDPRLATLAAACDHRSPTGSNHHTYWKRSSWFSTSLLPWLSKFA